MKKETELERIARRIRMSKSPEAIFGDIGTGPGADDRLTASFKHLATIVHPDHHQKDPALLPLAEAAFKKLADFYHFAKSKIRYGTYGDGKERDVYESPPPSPGRHHTVTYGKFKIDVGALLRTGDVADIYDARLVGDGAEQHVILKIPQHPSDNDMIEHEAEVLKKIYPLSNKEEKYYRYLPRLLHSFPLKTTKVKRTTNIMPFAEGYVSLADIMRAYPEGIDFRDMVWMLKRTLVALGFVHRQGYVHGAITPEHVLVHPITHGAKIVDWCYATKLGERVKAMSGPRSDFYAPEIPEKGQATPSTDIFMAAKCAVGLLGGTVSSGGLPAKVPPAIVAFLQGCMIPSPRRRPTDPWKLHDEFVELLLQLVGKPKYRELRMPMPD